MKRPTGLKYKKHKDNPTSFKKGLSPWNKGTKGVCVAWNRGLSKENDERIARYAKTIKDLGIRPIPSRTAESYRKISLSKQGDKNPAKRPDVREKIRNSILRMYKIHPEVLNNRKPSGINQFSKNYSSIELLIANEFHRRNIHFIHNFRIGRYFADFLIFDRVVVECDGEYWHKDLKKEYEREKYLHSGGFFTFHLLGKRIKKSPNECIDMIEKVWIGLMNESGHPRAAGFVCEQLPFCKKVAVIKKEGGE